jgi:hypothetical protein
MITRASGSFNGTVTHSAGYVQGDGSTGYFDLGHGMSGDGCTLNNSMLFVLSTVLGTNNRLCVGVSTTAYITTLPFLLANGASVNKSTTWNGGGIIGWSTESGPDTYAFFRNSTGSEIDDDGIGAATTAAQAANVYALARNNGGAQFFMDGRISAVGYGLGITQSQSTSFSLALKNLWETCTSLTLP